MRRALTAFSLLAALLALLVSTAGCNKASAGGGKMKSGVSGDGKACAT